MIKLFLLKVSLKMMNNGHKIFKIRKISKNAHKNRNSAPFRVLMRYLDRARRELSESMLKSVKIIFRKKDICEKQNIPKIFWDFWYFLTINSPNKCFFGNIWIYFGRLTHI
jgi:hypothetical protein